MYNLFTYGSLMFPEVRSHILSAGEWDHAGFEEKGIERFLSDYCGFDR